MIAILLVGWIMVSPPNEVPPTIPMHKIPFDQWLSLQAFDTAKECEEGLVKYKVSQEPSLEDNEERKAQKRASLMAVTFSRCVPDYVIYPPPPGVLLNR